MEKYFRAREMAQWLKEPVAQAYWVWIPRTQGKPGGHGARGPETGDHQCSLATETSHIRVLRV